MAWRYLVGSMLVWVSSLVWGAQDPIGWNKLMDIPVISHVGHAYEWFMS
jgi:hypothetical protein